MSEAVILEVDGLNAAYGQAQILFDVSLALAHGEMLFRSAFLLAVGLVTVCGYVAMSRFYFFSSPLMGTGLALACYVASVVIARVAG